MMQKRVWRPDHLAAVGDAQRRRNPEGNFSGAAEMLRYRIFLAEAAPSHDPAAKKAAEDKAVAVLLKLSESRPDLRGTIYQQLVERLPKDAPVKDLDPLLLQGLMAKAYDESNKPPGSPDGSDRSSSAVSPLRRKWPIARPARSSPRR